MDKFNQKKIENFQIQSKNDQKWSILKWSEFRRPNLYHPDDLML